MIIQSNAGDAKLPLSLAVYRQLFILLIVFQPEEGELRLVSESLLPQRSPSLQEELLVTVRVDDGVRGLGTVGLVLHLQSVVTELPEGRRQSCAGFHFQHNFLYQLLRGDVQGDVLHHDVSDVSVRKGSDYSDGDCNCLVHLLRHLEIDVTMSAKN